MPKLPHYDIFISYRREGADATARLLYERLLRDGYRVAFDLETLRSGDFDEQILDAIRGCKDVIVVLAPGSLDRCHSPGDWVRQEIACAIETGKNVVPLMLRGFSFPPADELPPEIRRLPKKQGVSASMEHLDSSIDRLKAFLTAKPTFLSHRHVIGWTANFVVLAAAVTASVIAWTRTNPAPAPAPPPPPPADQPTNKPPEWIAGTFSPDRRAIRTERPGLWRPVTGWKIRKQHWSQPECVWNPGVRGKFFPKLHASAVTNEWEPNAGFVWRDSLSPRRDPGNPSFPGAEHPDPYLGSVLVPDPAPGSDLWVPGPHLAWSSPDPDDLSVSNDWSVVWLPGWTPSPDAHVRAGDEENTWVLDPGYACVSALPPVRPADLAVRWSPGARHPLVPHAYAGGDPDVWLLDPGYAWNDPGIPSAGASWSPGASHPDWPHVHAAPTPGDWLPDPGFRFDPARGGWSVLPAAPAPDSE